MVNIAGLIYMFIFCFQIILAIFVYKDSKKRGMNSTLWILITVLLPNLIGFIIYMVVRGQAGVQPKRQFEEKSKEVQSTKWHQNSRIEDRVDTRREELIDVRENSQEKQYYSVETPDTKSSRCQTCGRMIKGYPSKCPYCGAGVHNEMFEDDDLMRANSARKGIIAAFAIIIVISMLAFAIIMLTPFRYMKITEVADTFKYEIFNGNDKNSSSMISSKYSYWDGTKEKTIDIDKNGLLEIEFEMESKEGIVYAVLKDSDNNIMYNFPGNTKKNVQIDVKKGERYYISIVGQETKGFYKFKWSID